MPNQSSNKGTRDEQIGDELVGSDEVENTDIVNPHVRLVVEQAVANRPADEAEAFDTFVAYGRTPVG